MQAFDYNHGVPAYGNSYNSAQAPPESLSGVNAAVAAAAAGLEQFNQGYEYNQQVSFSFKDQKIDTWSLVLPIQNLWGLVVGLSVIRCSIFCLLLRRNVT